MRLTCYHWADCSHTEHLDDEGRRVGITEILDQANRPIHEQLATHECPACNYPDSNQDGIGIRPVLQ
jgi:hypothetical protein